MTKVKTGGGRFQASELPIYFVAACPRYIGGHPFTLVDVDHEPGEVERRLADPTHKLLMDSGIYSLTQKHARKYDVHMDEALSLHPTEIDGFDKLYSTYIETIGRYQDRLWGYIELDQGGAERKKETRARLEQEGLKPIPVYHPLNDGWDYFDELCQRYDRICVGNIVQATQATRKRIFATVWERRRKYPKVWIHLLGYSPSSSVLSLPAGSSADSSSYMYPLQWGEKTFWGATYGARAMLSPFGRLPTSYAVRTGDPDHYDIGAQFLCAEAHFMNATWRAQRIDVEALFGLAWDKPLKAETIRRMQ